MGDRRGHQHEPRALAGRDLSTLPTQPLRPHTSPHLQTADDYDQEAAKLQALAQRMELHLWVCSDELERARERAQQLQATAPSAGGNTGTVGASRHDLEQARLDMESYATVIIQIGEDYRAFLHQVEQYLAAADVLRGTQAGEGTTRPDDRRPRPLS